MRVQLPSTHPIAWNCGREVRHLVVNQADDGSSPFSSAISGCGVTQASESWALVATVRLCPPRPFAPVAQLEERDASNVEDAGSSPAGSSTCGSDVAGNMRVFQTRLE